MVLLHESKFKCGSDIAVGSPIGGRDSDLRADGNVSEPHKISERYDMRMLIVQGFALAAM